MVAEARKRNRSLDVIRSLAIVSVVCEHVSSDVLSGMPQLIGNVFGTLGVPLFVMLTGYLMVDRKYDAAYTKKFLVKNLLTLSVAAELWNIIWSVFSWIIGVNVIPKWTTLCVALFCGQTGSGLWFLPMIIGIYLGLPIVSHLIAWICEQRVREYGWLLLTAAIYFGTIIPTISELLNVFHREYAVESVLNLNIFGADVWGDSVWIVYLLLGYCVKAKVFGRIPTWAACVAAVTSAVALTTFHWWALLQGIDWDPYYANIFLVVCSVSLFTLLEKLIRGAMNENNPAIRITNWISRYSFAIYMLHFQVQKICMKYLISLFGGNQMLRFIAIYLLCFFGALVIARLLYMIRPLRKWMLLVK
ncbi:acyltransferase [Bifidobacterium dentium]|uniref:acyltransferase n=1 Tax=Bifidobacterium dentium TaxID=1689 RepID=UPI0018B0AA4D|nr:acyltransferase [Bifidobacterium dentium]MBF9691090.1 acyltransferase [Bifidobacterium dentium]